MAQFEVIALDTTTPQLRAPGSGDSYLMPRSLAISTGVVTASSPVLDLSQSWSASGVTFTGIKFNVTSDVSASGSLLMDLQVGGSSKFAVNKSGHLALGGVSNPFSWAYIWGESTAWNFNAYAEQIISMDGQTRALAMNSATRVCWTDTGSANARTYGLVLARDAANTLAQRNGVNAQTSRLYGTYTDASNYRRLTQTMSTGGVAEIKPEGAGTGASGNVLHISGLPTSNPGPGILWNNGGVVNVGT